MPFFDSLENNKLEDYVNSRGDLSLVKKLENHSIVVLFIIHQFVTHKTKDKSLQKNKEDLTRYLKFIGVDSSLSSGEIIKYPLAFNDTDIAKIKYTSEGLNLYIGYLLTELNSLCEYVC